MKICVTAESSAPQSAIDPRFGRARVFMVYDDETGAWSSITNEQNLQAAQGAGIQSASHIVNAGCTALISGHCGPKAFRALSQAGVSVYTITGGTVAEAVERFQNGELRRIENADVEGHW